MTLTPCRQTETATALRAYAVSVCLPGVPQKMREFSDRIRFRVKKCDFHQNAEKTSFWTVKTVIVSRGCFAREGEECVDLQWVNSARWRGPVLFSAR